MGFVANVVLASLFGLTLIDILLVFSAKDPLSVSRKVNDRLNLGDDNAIVLSIANDTNQVINFSMIEGYPVEMQIRSIVLKGTLLPDTSKSFNYVFTPKSRGTFKFGDVFIIMRSIFFMASRRIDIPLA